MAMLHVKNRNENIYDIEQEKKKSPDMLKPDMYTSKFKTKIKSEVPVQKAAHKTMGYAHTPLSPPSQFLKKNDGIRWRQVSDHKCFKKDLPQVPRREEVLKKAPAVQERNLRIENIKKVVKVPPSRPIPRFADTRNGAVHDLRSSGLMPQYIFRPNYGKVPSYLCGKSHHMGQNMQQQQQLMQGTEQQIMQGMQEQMMQQQMLHGGQQGQGDSGGEGDVKYVSQEERFALLDGLKANWEKLQKRYQGLPVLTDTQSKRIVKANLEKELKQLEQDIMLVESNPHIYVCESLQRQN